MNRRNWRVIGLWIAALALSAALIANTRFSTDMSAFLPRTPSAGQRVLVDQLREGVVSRLVLVAIANAPPETLPALSRSLAATLRADPQFAGVANGEPTGFERDRALLWSNRYLLSPNTTAATFTAPALHTALERDVALLGSDLGLLAGRLIPADPTGELFRLLDNLAGPTGPRTENGIWVSPDATRALLMIQTAASGSDIDAQERGLAAIDAAFSKSAPPAAHVVKTGPPVFAVQTRARIKGDAETLSTVATILVAAVLLFAYRSPLVLGLALLPVASGALAGVAAVAAVFGFVHGITLGFGVTLIGEAVDYAVYLFTQTPPDRPARDTLPRIWPILRLGMLTSVCGFSAMLFSGFDGFAQLGLFTIAGLLTALAVTRYVLPVLRPTGFARHAEGFGRPLAALMRLNPATNRALVIAPALAGVALLALHTGPIWENELSSMSPIPQAALAQDAALRRELGAPDARFMLVTNGANPEEALVAAEALAPRLAALIVDHRLQAVQSPASLLPSLATQRRRQQALPDAPSLAAALDAAAQNTPFRPGVFAPFQADIATARTQNLLTPADLAGTGIGLRLDTLLIRSPAGWTALLPLHGVADAPAIAAAFASGPAVFLDLKAESDHLLETFRTEALTLSLGGALAIVVLLAATLRQPRATLAVLAPLAAALVCTTAILLSGQGRLSIFNLFGLLLIVAVGSNYALFFARHQGDQAERRRMISSLVLADLCTVIGFGVLALSAVPVLHGIGSTVAIGACLSLVFAALLDPRTA